MDFPAAGPPENVAPRDGAFIGAVIVTYFPDPAALAALLEATAPQAGTIIVIDNTTAGAVETTLADLAAGADIVVNGSNRGLAAAQNQGIERAAALGCTHVLLLDQDSVPMPGMVDALLAASERLRAMGVRCAAVGPLWHDRNRGRDAPFVRLGWGRMRKRLCRHRDELIECDTLVSSGMLIPLSVLREVGPMDESLFIDQVDVDWGLRAQARGMRLFGVCAAVLQHAIGERSTRVWFDPRREIPVHAPVRDYFIARNSLTVFFRRPAPWRWRLFVAVMLPLLIFVMLTQVPPRRQRLHMIARGLVDGLRGKLGPAPSGINPPPGG